MDSKIPLPTDNIYKFYALFGLLLFIASMFVFVQWHNTQNEQGAERFLELERLHGLQDKGTLTDDLKPKLALLEQERIVAAGDKTFVIHFLSYVIAAAIYLMGYGFYKWHTFIQPLQDKSVNKQLEKLELEIKALQNQNRRYFRR